MTSRGATLLTISLSALYAGMSLGGRMFYIAAIFGLLTLLCALASVLFTRARMRVTFAVKPARALRGEGCDLRVTIGRRALLPVYPFDITVRAGEDTSVYAVAPRWDKPLSISVPLSAAHVGALSAQVTEYALCDLLGLFRLRGRPRSAPAVTLVLPRAFAVVPLRFLNADDGRALPNRQSEDLSSPEDTRAYRAGDPLKRVHWKLSARRRALIVRRFETPAPPDTLVLLDCTTPGDANADAEERARLRDALCETALSVATMQAGQDCPVRVPLYGENATEFQSDRSGDTALLQEMLARQAFMGDMAFERVLTLELRRMRRTGATVIITSRLSADVVEGVGSIRRMGPAARVYLVTETPDAPRDRPYVTRLQQYMVEVCYVTPS